jgi:sterol 3beta-glucosyltransferase
MRITIIALGSRGDVLPYVALGAGLRAVGHRVRVATFADFLPSVTAHGLDFHPIQGDAQAILGGPAGRALAASGRNVVRGLIAAVRSFGALADGYARDLSSPALHDTEVLINQLPACLYGYDLAERLGVPLFTAAVMPLSRTRAFPMIGFPAALARLPGYNRLTYRLAELAVWQAFRSAINRWREETLGLPRLPAWGYMEQMDRLRVPVLNGFSARVVPRPADWGNHVHVTGYWFSPEEPWEPPPALAAFLEAGPPPVFVGFGSMPVPDPGRLTATVVEALRQCGLCGVLQAGWGGLAGEALPGHVLGIGYAPYGWLFPRMAAVVHHGGSGTTAAGLRAGVPALVVPFVFDQFYWGERLVALGVGPAPVPVRDLSVQRLAEGLQRAVHDREMCKRAARLGAQIRAEDGIARAVETLHQYLR